MGDEEVQSNKKPTIVADAGRRGFVVSTRLLEFNFYMLVASLFVFALGLDYALFNDDMIVKLRMDKTRFGGRLKFLTIINLHLQTLYFCSCLAQCVLSFAVERANKATCTHLATLRKVNNFLYTSIAFPIGTFVSLIFWGLYAIDRELIFPRKLDSFIPAYHNHLVHTLPVIAVCVEAFIVRHKYHPSLIRGSIPTMIFTLAYIAWILIIAAFGGFWVYPVLQVLSSAKRVLFIVVLTGVIALFYALGKWAHDWLWPTTTTTTKSQEATNEDIYNMKPVVQDVSKY